MELSRISTKHIGPVDRLKPRKPSTGKADTPSTAEQLPQEVVVVSRVSSPIAPTSTQATPKPDVQAKFLDFKPPQLGSHSGPSRMNPNGTIALFDSEPSGDKKDAPFTQKYGPWGVVTGASQGVGAEYARALAEKGMNVVMVARSGDKMTKLAKELSEEHGVSVRVLPADLNTEDGVE